MNKNYELSIYDWKETDSIIEDLMAAANRRQYVYETSDALSNDSRSFIFSEEELTQTKAIALTLEELEAMENG